MIECESRQSSLKIKTDQRRLKQVLINLLSNSYKFTENGYIRLRVRTILNQNISLLQFAVKDSGVGINKSDMARLFKMFSIDSQSWGQFSKYGSGVGLSISKKFVESLGGQISVASEEGSWTEFTFTIKYTTDQMSNNCQYFKSIEEVKVIWHKLQNVVT